jgi:hypothetical protein
MGFSFAVCRLQDALERREENIEALKASNGTWARQPFCTPVRRHSSRCQPDHRHHDYDSRSYTRPFSSFVSRPRVLPPPLPLETRVWARVRGAHSLLPHV